MGTSASSSVNRDRPHLNNGLCLFLFERAPHRGGDALPRLAVVPPPILLHRPQPLRHRAHGELLAVVFVPPFLLPGEPLPPASPRTAAYREAPHPAPRLAV